MVVPALTQLDSPARPGPEARVRRLLDARLLLLLVLVAVGSRSLLAPLLDGPVLRTAVWRRSERGNPSGTRFGVGPNPRMGGDPHEPGAQ